METKNRLRVITILSLLTFISSSVWAAPSDNYSYYLEEYEPIYITPDQIIAYEDEHFIKGLTCISYENAYCSTATLEMIGLKHGINKDVHYYNWLT